MRLYRSLSAMNFRPLQTCAVCLPLYFAGFSEICHATPEGIAAADWSAILEAGPRSPISQQAYLKASNSGKNDYFDAVAISGDTVIVGAPFEDSKSTGVDGKQNDDSLSNSGAAYIYTRSGGKWAQQAYLKASDPGKKAQFGLSVAVSGDTAVVGAFGAGSQAGAAYVFTRVGTKWTEQQILKASNTAAGSLFGYSVAVSGETVVVGAFGDPSNATGVGGSQTDKTVAQAGAAYVFTRSGTAWTQQAYLKASNTDRGDLFGISVAVLGDTVVVGAAGEDSVGSGKQANNGASQAGAAYVFLRTGTAWKQQAYLKASNAGSGDMFGRAVAISPDTIVIGANQESSSSNAVDGNQADNSAAQAGAAYVFARRNKAWKQQAYLKASNSRAGDQFGFSVAAAGDLVVVGAYGESSRANGVGGDSADKSAAMAGAAYVFLRSGSTWKRQVYLKASKSGAGDQFGYGVAVAGDTAIISASGEASNATGVNGAQGNNSLTNAGAAYVFGGLGSVSPEIEIETPSGKLLADGNLGIAFDAVATGTTQSESKVLTIRNTGTVALTRLAVTLDGADASSFSVSTTGMTASVAPGDSTSFSVSFQGTGTATATQIAAIHVASNDLDENSFDIALSAQTFSTVADKDADGLNDWAEYQYAKLGFDWQVAQSDLVTKLKAGANAAGLYSQSELRTLNVATPFLVKNATTGEFKLTLGLQQSTGLSTFTAFPMTLPKTTINPDGKLEFLFTSPDKAAFYRVQAQ